MRVTADNVAIRSNAFMASSYEQMNKVIQGQATRQQARVVFSSQSRFLCAHANTIFSINCTPTL
jgi:hypothetical protein